MAEVVFTDRADGDFGVDRAAGTLDGLRRGVFDEEWTWLRQVHGAEVVAVDRPGHRAGATADAAVTGATGAVLCVQTADCVPVVLVGDGVVGVAHAGWRGLVAGVIGSTVDAMVSLGGGVPVAVIGPCIRPRSYAFGADMLGSVELAVGGRATATTADGAIALDMGLATSHALRRAGVTSITDQGADTAEAGWFSHRVRGDQGRQVTAVQLVAA